MVVTQELLVIAAFTCAVRSLDEQPKFVEVLRAGSGSGNVCHTALDRLARLEHVKYGVERELCDYGPSARQHRDKAVAGQARESLADGHPAQFKLAGEPLFVQKGARGQT